MNATRKSPKVVSVPRRFQPGRVVTYGFGSERKLESLDRVTGNTALAFRAPDGELRLRVGCQNHSFAEWRKRGRAIIRAMVNPSICAGICCEDYWRDEFKKYGARTKKQFVAKQRAYSFTNLLSFLTRAERMMGKQS